MAREDLITEAPLDPLGVDVRRDPFAGPFRRLDAGPDPIVTAQAMLAQVLSSKAPETRLERLIRSVLESGQFAPDALALVTYAKAVEAQMMSGGDG
jgi:hypothetical protein